MAFLVTAECGGCNCSFPLLLTDLRWHYQLCRVLFAVGLLSDQY
jgi:hypothetical protein